MTTSGTVGQIEMTLHELLEAAFRACRIVPQNATAEMLVNGRKALQRMLAALPARTVPLWAQDHQILPFPVGARAIPLPAGTIDVLSAHVRTYARLEAQQSSVGAVQTYSLPAAAVVSALAFRPTTAGALTLTADVSTDAVHWTTVWAPGPATYPADRSTWVELDPVVTAQFVRLSGVSAGQIADFMVGGNSRDREISRMSHDDYVRMGNATAQGMPLQYWLDRQAAVPVMRLWPLPGPETADSVLSFWRQRHIEDVGAMTQTLEIPARWEESIVYALAYRIAIDTPQVDVSIVQMLKPLSDEFNALMAADERDRAPITFNFGLAGYTR